VARTGLALLLVLGGAVVALAQSPRVDPVEKLRSVLRAPCRDVAARDRAVKECLGSLRTLNDLGKAMTLADWQDRHPDEALAAADAANRAALSERFFAAVRGLLGGGDATVIQNTLALLAQTAEAARANGDPPAPVSPLAPDVAALVSRGPPGLRGAAARALGQIDPDLAVALPALGELLRSADPGLRQAAVEGLTGLLQSVARNTARPAVNGPAHSNHAAAAAAAAEVLPLVGRALNDWHPGVRRRAVGAVQSAAASLSRMISDPLAAEQLEGTEGEVLRLGIEEERAGLRPLVVALAARGPALAFMLREGGTEVRLQAQKALEEMAYARERWLLQQAALGTSDDPFAEGLRAAVPRLASSLADPDPRIRRSAIDVLDLLGPLAMPAGKALASALDDSDRFVRWSAARALSHLGPPAVGEASARLTRLLSDPDPDVRRAAADALARIR
jgi:HEAT repeat protein